MAERRKIHALSLLVGALIGSVLAYFYEVNLWMYGAAFTGDVRYWAIWGWWSLIVFLAIPALAGFIAGLIDPSTAMQNGLYVGLLSGVVNAIVAVGKLFYLPAEQFPSVSIVYAFSLSAVMSVFLWMIIAAAAGRLAKQY